MRDRDAFQLFRLLGLTLVFLWLAVSLITFLGSNATAFQRAGAFGVAAAVLAASIDLQRVATIVLRFEEVQSRLASRAQADAQLFFEHFLLSQKGESLMQRLLVGLRDADLNEQSEIAEALDEYQQSAESARLQLSEHLNFIRDDEGKLRASAQDASRRITNRREQIVWAQTIQVVLGTVQWGYGDVLHRWLHGNGVTECSC